VLATVLALAGPVLPTRYRGDGGLALAGEGLMDIPMLTDRRFPTRDTATHIAVGAILSIIIHMSSDELLRKVILERELGSIRKRLEELKKQEVKNA
jgi:hypothetical protein